MIADWWGQLCRRLAVLFHGDRFARELEEEMARHVEIQAAENEAAGMSGAVARRAARRQFGNAAYLGETGRDAWGWRWLETLGQDLRFAVRLMRREPLFTAVAVVTLGIAIGGNTLVFSLVEAVVLRPLPYADPDRLYVLNTVESDSQRAMNTAYPDFRDWQQQSRQFSMMAASCPAIKSLAGGAEPERVDALRSSAELFELLAVRPVLGRTFAEGEDRVAVLSERLWKRRYGGDPGLVGRTIPLDGAAYTVIGVMPASFHFSPRRYMGDPELFLPLAPERDRTKWYLSVLGRLRPGANQQQAQAEMNSIAARLAATYPPGRRRQGIQIASLTERTVLDVRKTGFTLLGAVGFVLLIACANVANLGLAQCAARTREIAIRTAIGAGRTRILRQMLTESLLLAVFGAVLGMALAYWGLPAVAAVLPAGTTFATRVHDTGMKLNTTVLAFTAGISLAAAILFGILPAFRASRPAAANTRAPRQGRVRGGLIAFEVALCFVLLVGAGLMINTMWRLVQTDLGIRPEHLLTMEVRLAATRYPAPGWGREFFEKAIARLQSLPGVTAAGAASGLPMTLNWSALGFEIEGRASIGRILYRSVTQGYLDAMGIRVINGRGFTESDSPTSPGVALINRTMAVRFWPKESPIGHVVAHAGDRMEIVGVVSDIRNFGPDSKPRPEIYVPASQAPMPEMSLVLRTAGDPMALAAAARQEIWRIDADQPVSEMKTMDEWLSENLAPRRFVLWLVGLFALVATGLAAVGIFGVVSYSVRQRTQEIGIRLALGARPESVIGLVLRQTSSWLLAGIAGGAAGAWGLTRLLKAYLYGVTPTDSTTFLAAAMALAAVAVAASVGPARAASRVDPLEALRHE